LAASISAVGECFASIVVLSDDKRTAIDGSVSFILICLFYLKIFLCL
jgi:hypothetical protein